MKRILLFPRERKIHAFVDAADYERVKKYRWYIYNRPGRLSARRYVETETGMASVYLHAEILGKAPPGMVIDHKNRDPLDCRRSNLRLCTQQQNTWNRGPNRTRKYSRYKSIHIQWRIRNGVRTLDRKPWYVLVQKDGRSYCRGMFADEKEAWHAAGELRKTLHGDFACVEPWQGYSDTPALRELLAVTPSGHPRKRLEGGT